MRDSAPDNEITWLVKNIIVVINNLFSIVFTNDSGNAINEIPHILAGKIEAKHLMLDTKDHVYILAFSEGILASTCFLSFLISGIFAYAMVLFTLKKVYIYLYHRVFPDSHSLNQGESVIEKHLQASEKAFTNTFFIENIEVI